MTFKEELTADIGGIFLNLDEFGELHVIDGVERPCIIDDSLEGLEGKAAAGIENSSMLGLDGEGRTIYLADEIRPRPVPGQNLEIDGETWTVIPDAGAVSVHEGLLVLKLLRAFS